MTAAEITELMPGAGPPPTTIASVPEEPMSRPPVRFHTTRCPLADCYRFLAPPGQGLPPDGRGPRKEDIRMEQSAVTKVVKRAAVLAVVAGLSVTAAPIKAQTSQRPIGDIEVFATLPYPGHPGGLAVAGRTLYVNTSNADFDRLFDTSDEIWAYNLDSAQPKAGVLNPIQVVRAASVQTMVSWEWPSTPRAGSTWPT